MDKKLKVLICNCLTCAMMASFPVQSLAIMLGSSTENLTKHSDLVIVGQVQDTRSYWSPDGQIILTEAEVQVEEAVNGDASAGEVITVEFEGGEVDDVGLHVSDEAEMKAGEKVLLFLKKGPKDHQGVHTVVGHAQGKYSIDAKGIARKGGFSIANQDEVIDNDIPVNDLMEKIRKGVQQ